MSSKRNCVRCTLGTISNMHWTSVLYSGSCRMDTVGHFGGGSQFRHLQAGGSTSRPQNWPRFSVLSIAMVILLLGASASAARSNIHVDHRYEIDEETDSGTFVGNIFEDHGFRTKYNSSGDILGMLTFSIMSSSADGFMIEARRGIIRTDGIMDRDAICPNLDTCEVVLEIGVNPVAYFEQINVVVTVRDINDNYPVFSETRVNHAVREMALIETRLVTLNVVDLDSPPFSIQRVQLLPNATEFGLKKSQQLDGSTRLQLVVKGNLDHEVRSEYNLRIVAYDGGSPVKTGSADITITVIDANDNRPTFSSEMYEVTVPEDISLRSTVIRVEATDADSGEFGELHYDFTAPTKALFGDIFEIDADTGDITVIGELDYETAHIYNLEVTARDRSPDGYTGECMVSIEVTDINDHAPQITIGTVDGSTNNPGQAVVPENHPADTFVARVKVEDPDSGDNGEVLCALGDTRKFHLNYVYGSLYHILSAVEFDREEQGEYSLSITCTDRGVQRLSSTRQLRVVITDTNDHSPIFDKSSYNADLIENNFEGASVIHVVATDEDIGVNAELEYSLGLEFQSLFHIDPRSGVISAQRSLDREQRGHYELSVFAVDGGNPALTASASVTITIQDVNDEGPRFSQDVYSFGVYENEGPGTEVGSVSADDADQHPNDQIIFSFTPDPTPYNAFRIDSNTGQVTTLRVLDREVESIFHLVVMARDYNNPDFSATASVSVFIADQNDNAPAFIFPTRTNNTVSISSEAPQGYILTRVFAEDKDIGNNGKVTYSVSDGHFNEFFDIDSARGVIFVNRKFSDLLDDAIFELNITATDSGLPQYSAVATLYVVVNTSVAYPVPPAFNTLSNTNMIVVIVLGVTSGVITVILVLAIIFIQRRGNHNNRNGRYNCRVETLKFLTVKKDPKLVNGTTSSTASTDNGCCVHGSGPNGGPRKEVSFNMEMAGNQVDTSVKSGRSWPSVIDHQTLQTPRACSSMIPGQTPPMTNGPNCHGNGSSLAQYNPMRPLPLSRSEIEMQQLLELLQRDPDESSLNSAGDGSNADSGRGASEEGEGNQGDGRAYPLTTSANSGSHLPRIPEDSYSTNQVVPNGYNNNSVSFASTHNSTLGSYRPPDRLRTFQPPNPRRGAGSYRTHSQPGSLSDTASTAKSDLTRLSSTSTEPSDNTLLNSGFRDSVISDKTPPRPPKNPSHIPLKGKVTPSPKSHLSPPRLTSPPSPIHRDQNVPSESSVLRAHRLQNNTSDGEADDFDTECTDAGIRYSCMDVSDVLRRATPKNPDLDVDGDCASTTTSGSYTVDPQDLVEEIDEIFFQN